MLYIGVSMALNPGEELYSKQAEAYAWANDPEVAQFLPQARAAAEGLFGDFSFRAVCSEDGVDYFLEGAGSGDWEELVTWHVMAEGCPERLHLISRFVVA